MSYLSKTIIFFTVAAGFIPAFVHAEDTVCSSSYGGLGYSCNKSNDCDSSQEIKDQTEGAYQANQKGTVDGAVITGVCSDEKLVCCVKKSAPGGGTTGSGDTAGPSTISDWIKSNYGKPKNYAGPIPECAFSGSCRDTNDLVTLFIEQGRSVFGFIGMIALAAFVYGGFLMVFSFGSSDKVQQGKEVMVAAVIGIIIVFSAYLVVNFILNALGVSPDFQAIK
jgi:hypothetical protein